MNHTSSIHYNQDLSVLFIQESFWFVFGTKDLFEDRFIISLPIVVVVDVIVCDKENLRDCLRLY